PGDAIRDGVSNATCLLSIISATPVTIPVCRDQGSIALRFDSAPVGNTHFGANPHVFAWSNGANSKDITVSQPGNYSVLVTDSNGCSATIQVTVTQNPADSCKSTGISTTSTERQYVSLYPNPA